MRQDLRTTRKYKMWRQFCELAGVQTYVNFPRHLLVLRPVDRLAPIKVSNTIMAAVASMSASRSIHFLWPFWRRPDTMPSIAHRAPSYSCSKLVPHNPPSSPHVTPVLLFVFRSLAFLRSFACAVFRSCFSFFKKCFT